MTTKEAKAITSEYNEHIKRMSEASDLFSEWANALNEANTNNTIAL